MKKRLDTWLSRLHQHTKQRAPDKGVTLQEVLIGIAIAAVLAAGSILIGARYIGQGQAASGRTTLQNAVLASEAVYARILPGGVRNWTGDAIPAWAGTVTDPDKREDLTLAAVENLNDLEESFRFIPVLPGVSNCSAARVLGSASDRDATELKIPAPASSDNCVGVVADLDDLPERTIWVHVDIEAADVASTGQVIRMGMQAADGSTMCLVSVKRGLGAGVAGRGWQAVDEDTSAATPADCGVFDTTDAAKAAESPGTSGTDSSLPEPKSGASAYP